MNSDFNLKRIINLEQKMVSELKKHSGALETAINDIGKYVTDVMDVYRDCSDKVS